MTFSQVTLTVNGTPYTFNVNPETTTGALFDSYNADINQISSIFAAPDSATVTTLGSTSPSNILSYSYLVPPSPTQQLATGYINSQVLGNFAYVYLSSPPDSSAIAQYGLTAASSAQIVAIHTFENSNNLSSPSGLIYVTNQFTSNPFPVSTIAGLNTSQVELLKTSLSDLWNTTANGQDGNYYTSDMVTNLNMLFLSLQMVGIDPRNVDQFSDTDVRWNAWKDLALASPVLQQVFQFPSSSTNHTLQSLIELSYVKTGNDMISTQLGNLVSALSTTEQVLNSLGGLQELSNNMIVQNRDPLQTVFEINNTSITNSTYISIYKTATSTYFGGPIFPTMTGATGTPIDSTLAFLLGKTSIGLPNFSNYPGTTMTPFFSTGTTSDNRLLNTFFSFNSSPTYVHFNSAPPADLMAEYGLSSATSSQLTDILNYEISQGILPPTATHAYYVGIPNEPNYYVSNTVYAVNGDPISNYSGRNGNDSYLGFGYARDNGVSTVGTIPNPGDSIFFYVYTNNPLSSADMASLGLTAATQAQKDKISVQEIDRVDGSQMSPASANVYVTQLTTWQGASGLNLLTDPTILPLVNAMNATSNTIRNTYKTIMTSELPTAIQLRTDGYSIANVGGQNEIIPPAVGDPDASILQSVFGVTIDPSKFGGFETLKENLVALRGSLLSAILALSASTPASSLNDPNSLYNLTKQVYNDIQTAFTTGNGSPVLSSTPLTSALVGLQRWVLDNYNTTSASAGAYQQHMSFAITSAQNLNTSQQQNVQSFLFLFDQYYKSASSILKQVSSIIVQMGQHIKQ